MLCLNAATSQPMPPQAYQLCSDNKAEMVPPLLCYIIDKRKCFVLELIVRAA